MRGLCSAAALTLSLLVACGGGSDDTTPVQTTSFSAAEQVTLAGDWPATTYNYYVVQREADWQALWAERKAALDCSRSYNDEACRSTSPPVVDFTRFAVIGVYLGYESRFTDQSPRIRSFHDANGVQVRFSSPARLADAPRYSTPEGEFVLIPATRETISIGPE